MVGNVIELVFEKEALPDGSPVTVVQFLSRKGESSPLSEITCFLRDNMPQNPGHHTRSDFEKMQVM